MLLRGNMAIKMIVIQETLLPNLRPEEIPEKHYTEAVEGTAKEPDMLTAYPRRSYGKKKESS